MLVSLYTALLICYNQQISRARAHILLEQLYRCSDEMALDTLEMKSDDYSNRI